MVLGNLAGGPSLDAKGPLLIPLLIALLLVVPLPEEDLGYEQAKVLLELEAVNGPYTWESQVREMIGTYFPEGEVEGALAVAWCESGLDPEAENPRSSASGLFQFLDKTWESVGGGDRFDPWVNTRNAARLWRQSRSWAAWSCG